MAAVVMAGWMRRLHHTPARANNGIAFSRTSPELKRLFYSEGQQQPWAAFIMITSASQSICVMYWYSSLTDVFLSKKNDLFCRINIHIGDRLLAKPQPNTNVLMIFALTLKIVRVMSKLYDKKMKEESQKRSK